jgi:hypothetical protein
MQSIPISTTESGLDPEIAVQIALGEHAMRRDLAGGILRTFVVGNSAVWFLVIILVVIDVVLIAYGHQTPDQRVIDRSVVKTLVAATAVQVGALMVAIATNLFPKRDDKPWWKLWG